LCVGWYVIGINKISRYKPNKRGICGGVVSVAAVCIRGCWKGW